MRFNWRFITQLLVCTVLMVFTRVNLSSAQAQYPLAKGEQVLEERLISGGGLPKTGLKINKFDSGKSTQLSNALEKQLRVKGYSLANLPPVLDYSGSPYLPTVGLQNEDSCVGWSVGYYLRTYQQARDIGWDVKKGLQTNNAHVFSPSFVYNQINQGADNGAYLSDAGELLKQKGAATLASFPYIPGDYTTQPGADIIQKAAPHKIREWGILYTSNDSMDFIIQKTKQYLNTGDILVAGSRIGFNFIYPMTLENGKSIIITDNYATNGHAYVVVGYDDNLLTPEGRGAFKILNSWGKDWGDQGFSYITYQAFKANIVGGYVFTDLVNGPTGNSTAALPVSVKDEVYFNLNFLGKGSYSIEIRDSNENLINRMDNLQAEDGLAQVKWSGNNNVGQGVNDGEYELIIFTDKNGEPQATYKAKFFKQSTTKDVKAVINSLEDFIQSVGISFIPQVEGKVTISIKNQANTSTIISDNPVKPTVPFEYIINRAQFDFNKVDLSNTSIVIEVK